MARHIKGRTISEWKDWLEGELKDDGKEHQVFHHDRDKARLVYRWIIEGFLELIKEKLTQETVAFVEGVAQRRRKGD